MSKNDKNERKNAFLGGLLATAILAAVFAYPQMLLLQSATAQAQNSSQPVMTNGMGQTVTANFSSSTVDGNISRSTISTSGTATTKVKPDKISVTVGAETNGTTAEEAASKNANLTAGIIAILKGLGIAENQTGTTNYNLSPVYGQKPVVDKACIDINRLPPECVPRPQITGYVATNSLSITLAENGTIDPGKVIDTAIGAGANNVNGVFFFTSQEKQEKVRDSLIQQAIANARQKANIAASAVDMQVSGIQSMSLNDAFLPVLSGRAELQATTTAEASTPNTQILPGEQEVTMTVNVVYFVRETQASTIGASGGGEQQQENNTVPTDKAVAITRQFILSKLPSLGIQISNELDLHIDTLSEMTESEFHVEFGMMDTKGQSHVGNVEITNGEVTVAILDGKSIL
jgi:uncharacterized protein